MADDSFNLPKVEEEVLAFWEKRKIFEKSLKKKKRTFVFYEGPPYANGKPGIHHVLARVVKDVMLRYKTMRGYYVPRRGGWDTHGLPVEMAAEKALGFKSKRDIEKFGIKAFNEKAKEQVWIHKDEWERLTRRIGYWLDLKNAYVTYAPEYIETVWWTLAEIWKRKLLFKGHKVVQWCTRCGTALSSHELAQGYQTVTENSVYIKFRLKSGQKIGARALPSDSYILSWTTTPWTLPGNVALAVGEKIRYVLVRVQGVAGDCILAKDLLRTVFKDNEAVDVLEDNILGKDLVGLVYEPLFDIKAFHDNAAAYKVHAANFVTTTDGTGIVHTAVMYGEDDYNLGKKIGLPERHTVDEEGKFTKDVPELASEYAKAKDTEARIFAHLERGGTLLRVLPYTHEYPHCWRCGTPVLYYARTSWFIKMSTLRNELLARNKKISWFPEHVKEGRFGEWLREVKDWNLSRERYWGAPLPVWECRTCGATEVVDGLEELSRRAGGSKNHYWVMRHGEAESNMFDIIDSGERKFLHLTPRGRKQAETAIARFASKQKIDVVIASDITRTRETEKIDTAALAGAHALVDARLEEIHLGPTLAGYRDQKYGELFPTYEARFATRPTGGESVRDLRARVWDFLRHCESKYEGKNILIVSHEYPIWMLTQAAEGWSERRAIAEKERRGSDFIKFAEIRPLNVMAIPRNDTGEVDLHRPFVDEIFLHCAKCGGHMRRVPEVADVWYDSGAMPLAQAHFPFAEKRVRAGTVPRPQAHIAYPADYIAEGMDQTRGWFYTLLAIATALGYEAPYRNVVTLGLINDKTGQKMSKSKGNIVEPFMVIEKYGVDALRWYFYTGTPLGEPKNFDEQEIAKTFRKTHLIVYNSFVFWKTYAAKGLRISSVPPKSAHVLDKWILARLAALVASLTKKLDGYEIREAALEIDSFVDDLSRWYIRRSRRRLQRPESAKDYRAASATLHYVLFSLIKLMAPFTPFFSEHFYAPLGGKKESVHLDEWPATGAGGAAGVGVAAKKLIAEMELVRTLAALGLARRAEAGIKVRQPLASLAVGVKLGADLQKILADEVNVKAIAVKPSLKDGVELDTALTPALREEGLLRDVARMVQELRQSANLMPKDQIMLLLELPAEAKNAVMKHEATLRADVGAKLIEYARSEKFAAESEAKLEGQPVWIGLRKV